MSKSYHFPEDDPVVTIVRADVYSLRWPSSYGNWAIFTVCDQTGELSIQSDWGNFSYRWNTGALGDKTLTEFLATVDAHYIADKLGYHNTDLAEVFDPDATLAEFRRAIRELRRLGRIGAADARGAWDLSEEFCDQVDVDGIDAVWHNADFDELFKVLPDSYELLCRKRPILWSIVKDELVPRLAQCLREPPPGRR